VSVGSSPAVRADGLGKRYEIGLRPWSGALYDRIGGLLRRGGRGADGDRSTLWALREVSFEVPQGHVLGVLGRNGSGKTTLMKILARVTAPTEGTALTYGRVGALLQVGTGFHPELSGRDNIALSGAILGMSRAEVAARAEQIIDFAEIGRFLDTPVKHYSSGMYLRLAFSVSAHLAADILLVDEVLAVGDAAFQKKSRERIRSLVAEGRTVLFVSHQMASVKELCDSALVLDQGRMIFIGDTHEAVKTYDSELVGRH
jgi:ABC-type polysaccharide/polyol phosphate transport system ATPase subunit